MYLIIRVQERQNNMVKDLIKRQSKETYKGKDGKEHHYYNLYLVLESGKYIQIKACFENDKQILNALAKYVG